jgi:hypothetical protein
MLVDVRENEKGTPQRVILVASHARVALGVHTWIEGYLGPVYRDTLQALAKAGYPYGRGRRGCGHFTAFVTNRVAFPEFQDPFAEKDKTRLKSEGD